MSDVQTVANDVGDVQLDVKPVVKNKRGRPSIYDRDLIVSLIQEHQSYKKVREVLVASGKKCPTDPMLAIYAKSANIHIKRGRQSKPVAV
jgi:hypothetical protein